MSTPLVCSCGSTMFHRSYRTGGWWIQTIDEHGEVVDTNIDGVKLKNEPKTIACVECGKRKANPDYRKGGEA